MTRADDPREYLVGRATCAALAAAQPRLLLSGVGRSIH
jgi:hypothetical protein